MKILYVHPGLESFVRRDLEILSTAHDVRPMVFTGRAGVAKRLVPDLCRLWQGMLWCDVSFSWFGKLHGFFSVLFSKVLNKRAVVVAGGDDVASYTLNGERFGLCSYPVGKRFAYYTFRQADLVISISRHNYQETLDNTGAAPERVVLVPHGFDGNEYRPVAGIRREQTVSTVAMIDWETYSRKGIRLFIEAAKALPDVPFSLIGPDRGGIVPKLRETAPPNLEFTGGLYGENLIKALSRSGVYVQASAWESFGCSLAEAMLCECVPVASRCAAIPEVVGDSGFYVDTLEPQALAQTITEALQAPPDAGKKAREQIIRNYPIEQRMQRLLDAVASLGNR